MSLKPALSAAEDLVRARGRVLGPTLAELARRHAGASANELLHEITIASRAERGPVGLLLARVILEDAADTESRSKLNDFLFRLGAHLQASINQPGTSTASKQVLVAAADLVITNLPTATTKHHEALRGMKARIGEVTHEDQIWRGTIGLSADEFIERVETIGDAVRPLRAKPAAVAPRPQTMSSGSNFIAANDAPQKSGARVPSWLLHLPGPELASDLIAATANWHTGDAHSGSHWNPTEAWVAFVGRDFAAASQAVEPLRNGIGTLWGPNSTADHLRLWHWVRLVTELDALTGGVVANRRRSATSSFALASRCIPDDSNLLDFLLGTALDDFVAEDIPSRQAWGSYTVRLIDASDHETALAPYDNSQKAALRDIWREQFGLSSEEVRNTATSAFTLGNRFRRVTMTLHGDARKDNEGLPFRRSSTRDLQQFLDEGESALLGSATAALEFTEQAISQDVPNYDGLEECCSTLRDLQSAIATSGSLVLQDFLAPLVSRYLHDSTELKERLEDTSRPQIVVRLDSSRLPLSATKGTEYEIRLVIANTGNATARDIALSLNGDAVGISASFTLYSLGAGAEETITSMGRAIGASPPGGQIACRYTWSDALAQNFASDATFAVEDQRPASWTSTDVNPFSLGTISDPARLVGREDDLRSLEALLAGGGSAYITGHKRVGKTSLTRVLLRQTRDQRGWAGEMLPLGRAFGPEQSAADLVYAMMDEILGALSSTYEGMESLQEIEPDSQGNFARASNRWLKRTARVLPAEARMVLAIDDFDELPNHLLSGPQADALFLFLRTLVDERWLNLVLVGSEVLPTVIASQAHKLNQIVPVSVANFNSRSSSEELLVPPTSNRLEWDGSAIDRVHSLCQGNPYYETLLAQQIWLDLREKRRSFVTPADVNAGAHTVASQAPASHFVHLWADSSSGIDHTSRRAIITSSVLRAVARCGGVQQAPAQSDEVVRVAQTWIQSATEAELNQTISSLINRNILERGPSESTVVMAIPLVATWLGKAGASALDADYAGSNHANATARVVTESDLAGLSRGLIYRGEPISEIRIKAWLSQFGDNYHQHLAYLMLHRMISEGFFSVDRMHSQAMRRLRDAIMKARVARQIVRDNNGYMKNAFLVEHGVSGDSTQGTTSALCKTLKVKKANVVSASDVQKKLKTQDSGTVLFLLDDFSGSGKHLADVLDELVVQLDGYDKEWTEGVHLVVGAAVVVDPDRIPRTADPDVDLVQVSGIELGPRFRAFHPEAELFDSVKERQDAEQLVTTIGRALLPNNPLGFGGDALLASLEFNCPNNVPPIFWRRGVYAGTDWFPLFERSL